ncbi:hypothetical protein Ari01nite_32800 [Paractinoplanes rishiriensis]|uniref:Recombinase domain-containing protein n=1 Tax=Paractinoplanes rishiriensis TaxID=1050105 RepID=A0A919JYG8_9ACTN|nr:hypothetical protein Ari01nite_32800 [Actinoplanes rishiriensis]
MGRRHPTVRLSRRPRHPETRTHPEEAPILRDIFRLYTEKRLGTRAIATELNQRGIANRTGKPWSGYTVARILDNPAYVGDIAYRDVHVTDAHEPLIDRETFTIARDIADTRADAHTRRATSPSEYHLTGLITCPDCGHKYIGTAVRGRNARYRYYTCFSRNRYGAAGCTGARLAADATETAVLQALYDFYAVAYTLIDKVLAQARREFHDTHADRHNELDALTAKIVHNQTAIDRYHTAFENGTMDDATAGPRIAELRHKITQLQARRDDLNASLAHEPTPPPEGTIERLRAYLEQTITHGTDHERKRAIETLVAEIRINEKGEVIPVFKIPNADTIDVTSGTTATTTEPTTGLRNGEVGGAEGTRTPDPHTASVVRYQLRHSPLQVPGTQPGTGEILHTPRQPPPGPPQFSSGSGGKCATAARMSPWRRRTMAHRSSGRLMKGSPGRASSRNQEPLAISSSSWPADQPE